MVLGFGSLSAYRDRPSYSTTVEDSVYVGGDPPGVGGRPGPPRRARRPGRTSTASTRSSPASVATTRPRSRLHQALRLPPGRCRTGGRAQVQPVARRVGPPADAVTTAPSRAGRTQPAFGRDGRRDPSRPDGHRTRADPSVASGTVITTRMPRRVRTIRSGSPVRRLETSLVAPGQLDEGRHHREPDDQRAQTAEGDRRQEDQPPRQVPRLENRTEHDEEQKGRRRAPSECPIRSLFKSIQTPTTPATSRPRNRVTVSTPAEADPDVGEVCQPREDERQRGGRRRPRADRAGRSEDRHPSPSESAHIGEEPEDPSADQSRGEHRADPIS